MAEYWPRMIIVVEGISAAGKTTYCRNNSGGEFVAEYQPAPDMPPADAPAEIHAQYWTTQNKRRFQTALRFEQSSKVVLADTDPLKLHYDWCLWRAGFVPKARFLATAPLIRQAIADRQLGFADLYLVKHIEPELARRQKEGDPTRRRGHFERHLVLQPSLMEWYQALADVLPGRVLFEHPIDLTQHLPTRTKKPEEDPRRFDISVLDQLLMRLDACE